MWSACPGRPILGDYVPAYWPVPRASVQQAVFNAAGQGSFAGCEDWFISKKAILETIIAYSIILFISFLKGYLEIIRTNLIDLMNTLRKAEELPKVNYLKGFASLVTIGIAYYIAVNYGSYGFAVALFWSVILVILGTYWLFGSFMPMLVRLLVNRKEILYRGTNIISISNIAFRSRIITGPLLLWRF